MVLRKPRYSRIGLAALVLLTLLNTAESVPPADSASPGTPAKTAVSLVGGDVTLDWPTVDRRQATVLLVNMTDDAQNLKLELIGAVSQPSIASGVHLEHRELKLPPRGSAILVLVPDNQNESTTRWPFDAVLKVANDKGVFLTSSRIRITSEAVTPATTKFMDVSMHPLCSPWTVSFSIPLLNKRIPADLPRKGGIIGSLQSDKGGGIVNVRFDGIETRDAALVAKIEIAAMTRGHFVGNIYLDSAKTKESAVALTLEGQDNILYAILVIIAGIALAALSKIYLTTWRVLWLIKREAFEVPSLIGDARQKFKASTPDSAYDPEPDLHQQLLNSQAEINRFKNWERLIADNRSWFDDRLKELKSIESQLNDWINLGQTLAKLKGEVDKIERECESSELKERPLWMIDADVNYAGGPIAGMALAKALQDAQNWRDVGRSWMVVYQYWTKTRGDLLRRKKVDLATLQSIEQDLLAAETFEALGSIKGRIYAAAEGVVSTSAGGTSGVGLLEEATSAGAPAVPRVFMPPLVAGFDRRSHLRILVRDGDAASFIFGVAVATLSSLGTYYFGHPFGSYTDYIALFVAATATKAAVDLLTSWGDRFAGVSGTR